MLRKHIFVAQIYQYICQGITYAYYTFYLHLVWVGVMSVVCLGVCESAYQRR